MPAIAEKRTVLNGRGIVGVWANGTSAGKFFYREKVEAIGHIQILKGGNAFLSVHLIDEAARSFDLDPFH